MSKVVVDRASWLGLRRGGLRKRRFVGASTRIVPRFVSVYGAAFDVQLTDGVADAACSAGLVGGLR